MGCRCNFIYFKLTTRIVRPFLSIPVVSIELGVWCGWVHHCHGLLVHCHGCHWGCHHCHGVLFLVCHGWWYCMWCYWWHWVVIPLHFWRAHLHGRVGCTAGVSVVIPGVVLGLTTSVGHNCFMRSFDAAPMVLLRVAW